MKKEPKPFASKAAVTEDTPAELRARIESIQVPTDIEVGVPAYPKAVISFAVTGTSMDVHGTQVTTLPVIQLLSEDAVADVVKFYETKLEDWKHTTQYFTHEFRPPKESDEKVQTNVSRPFVKVLPTRAELLVPNAKSRIEIAYTPSKSKAD